PARYLRRSDGGWQRELGVDRRAVPWRAADVEPPVDAGEAVAQPGQAVTLTGVGAAAAVVDDLDMEAVGDLGDGDRALVCAAVLGGVGERFGDDEIGGVLRRGRHAPVVRHLDLDSV